MEPSFRAWLIPLATLYRQNLTSLVESLGHSPAPLNRFLGVTPISEEQADKWLETPRTKAISDREAAKFARNAVRRYRAK
jgi:hypothetical protein